MKKILTAVVIMLFIALSYSGVASAADEDTLYEQTLKVVEVERTDAYAIDFYKYGARWDDPLCVKWAKKITAGINDDYEKAKAIFNWVDENTRYAYGYDFESSRLIGLDDFAEYGYMQMQCVGYALLTQGLFNAAGLPAKTINGVSYNTGGSNWLHDWNEVYVDNRWVYVDSTWGEFDLPVTEWARDHSGAGSIMEQDEDAWDGSLYFYDLDNNRFLKEIKNFPLYGLVTSTYGFNIKDLYFESGEPFKLNKMKVDSQNCHIRVDYSRGKPPTMVQFILCDNEGYGLNYKGVYAAYGVDIFEDYTRPDLWVTDYKYKYNGYKGSYVPSWWVFTPVNAKLEKPIDPVRKGYTFLGWYTFDTGKKWDFATDKVTSKYDGMILRSRWKKVPSTVTEYKVTFQHNNGVSPKSIVVTTGSKLSKPDTPSWREGYKFVGWYTDSKCTKQWDFTKDKVTSSITLYAGWKKK